MKKREYQYRLKEVLQGMGVEIIFVTVLIAIYYGLVTLLMRW